MSQYPTPVIADFFNSNPVQLSTPAAAQSGSGFASLMSSGGMGGFAASGWGMLAQGILGGIAAESEYQAAKKNSQRQAVQGMNTSAYQLALQDWYQRRNKQETRLALGNYTPFSTMEQIAPGYKETYKPAELGAMPNPMDYRAGDNKKTNLSNYKTQQKTGAATVGTGG
jgi:hypothetical protein